MILFLDLDDTIFPTNTIDARCFEIPIRELLNSQRRITSEVKIQELAQDLWKIPFDQVASKHNLDAEAQNNFIDSIVNLDYKLHVDVYPDYSYLRAMNCDKFLITTGFKKLQLGKIESLGIQDDFIEIHIDEVNKRERIFKEGIFQDIIERNDLDPSLVWVIGDNPASEIAAANNLGLKAIQRIQDNKTRSSDVVAAIESFYELDVILFNN